MDNGIYRISERISPTLDVDVCGASVLPAANVLLWPYNDANNQKMLVGSRTVSGVAWSTIKALHSGQYLNVSGGLYANGSNVVQYPDDNGMNLLWTISDLSKTATVNGASVTAHKVASHNATYVLDATGASTAPATNVELWTDNGSDAQGWLFLKDSALVGSLGTPASVGFSTSATGKVVSSSEALTVYPTWVGYGLNWQCRVRSRVRYSASGIWSDWGVWSSPTTGSNADDGWGDAWSANETFTVDSLVKHGAAIVYVLDANADRIESQIEVRRFEPTGFDSSLPAHGYSSIGTVSLAPKPTFSVSSASFTPDGLTLTYASSWVRSGNSITLDCTDGAYTVASGFEVSDVHASGTLTVPLASMQHIPADGDTLPLSVALRTVDCTYEYTASVACAWGGSHGYSFIPTFAQVDGLGSQVRVSDATALDAWLVIEDGRGIRFVKSDAQIILYPPLGKSWEAFVTAYKGSSWGSWYGTVPEIDSGDAAAIWNFDDGYAILRYGRGGRPSISDGFTPATTSSQVNGREFESVFFGGGTVSAPTASGDCHDESGDGSGYDDFLKLSIAHYALYRTFAGDVANVAITDIKFSDPLGGWRDVAVTMKRRS